MANTSKADLVASVSEQTGYSKTECKAVIDATLGAIRKALEDEEKVVLTGFGSFEVRKRSAREGVKPGTSEKIQIPASKYPAFKPGKALKEAVN